MPGAVGAATSPGAKASDDGKMADQLHLAVASALDAASSRLFGDYPDVERSLNVVEDDAISALSGFASAGHVSPFPTPLSHPQPVSPRPIPRKMSIQRNPPPMPAAPLNGQKEADPTDSPTGVNKTPNMMPAGTPQAASDDKDKSKPKGGAVARLRQVWAEFERSEAAAEERSALLSATAGVEVRVPENQNPNDEGFAPTEPGWEGVGAGRTRSEVEVESFAFELESALGLPTKFKEDGEETNGNLPTTFEEEALQNEADMAGEGTLDNKAAAVAVTEQEDSAAGMGFCGGAIALPKSMAEFRGLLTDLTCKADATAAAVEATVDSAADLVATTATATEACPAIPGGTEACPTDHAADLCTSVPQPSCPTDCTTDLFRFDPPPASTEEPNENKKLNEDIEVRIPGPGPVDVDEMSHSKNLIDEFRLNELGIDDAAIGPVDVDEVSHSLLPEEYGLNELGIDNDFNFSNAGKKQGEEKEEKKRVTIVEDPVVEDAAAEDDDSSTASPDPSPRWTRNGKADDESTVLSLTFSPTQKKKSKKEKEKVMPPAKIDNDGGSVDNEAAAKDEKKTRSPKTKKKMFSSIKKALSTKKLSDSTDESTADDAVSKATC